MNNCPVCDSLHVTSVFTRDNIPVLQNILMKSYEEACQIARGDLSITQCSDCGFVFNRTFDGDKVVYNSQYENTQSYSTFFEQYLDDLVTDLVTKHGIRNMNVVEVGCGKGLFLKKIVDHGDNVGYGFDPSYIGPEVLQGGKLRFEKRLYDEDCTHIQADAVICRHVIEHISDPVSLLKTIRRALEHSPHAKVFFETPCVDWILDNKVMFDFFYEHNSYFNRQSITRAFHLAGFDIVKVKHIFNGQYLWVEAKVNTSEIQIQQHAEPFINNQAGSKWFAQHERKWRETVVSQLEHYAINGKVAIWGAGAKGVTFLNLIDPGRTYIDCVIDVNPNKIGNFLPGTGHEIIGIEKAAQRGLSTVIVMNPNYFEENTLLIGSNRIDVKLINIEEWSV
ncbi:methyltransferase domain-containing protein [Paenibacillus sp. GSMTC-2017]|nr:methyltransferase domain-containing protein [Paenibacillus sp. GSMTC-2017]